MESFSYFKFNAGKWLLGAIYSCSSPAKGLFIDLCCHYWFKGGKVSFNDAKLIAKLHSLEALGELESAQIIKQDSKGKLTISFLDSQIEDAEIYIERRREMGRKSGESRSIKRTHVEQPLNTGSTQAKQRVEHIVNHTVEQRVERALNHQNTQNLTGVEQRVEQKERKKDTSTTPVKGVVRTTTSESTNTDIRAPLWGRLSSWVGFEVQGQTPEAIQKIEKCLVEIKNSNDDRFKKIWTAIKTSDQKLLDEVIIGPGWWTIEKTRMYFADKPWFVINSYLRHLYPLPEENEN